MYKLVAIDLDGTLLNSDKVITPRTQEAIKKARQLGVTVVLASGRPIDGMIPSLETLGLTTKEDYVICYNGSYVYCHGEEEPILANILRGYDAKRVYELAQELDLNTHAFSLQHGLITPKDNPYTGREAFINGLTLTEFDFTTLEDDHGIIKAMFADDPEKLDAVVRENRIPEEFSNDYTVVRSAGIFLEFINKKSNKGIGVQAIAERLNLSPEEVICIGDAQNDHHMIQYAGLGVAMANADENTRAIADVIARSNNEDGVAQIIEEYILRL